MSCFKENNNTKTIQGFKHFFSKNTWGAYSVPMSPEIQNSSCPIGLRNAPFTNCHPNLSIFWQYRSSRNHLHHYNMALTTPVLNPVKNMLAKVGQHLIF